MSYDLETAVFKHKLDYDILKSNVNCTKAINKLVILPVLVWIVIC